MRVQLDVVRLRIACHRPMSGDDAFARNAASPSLSKRYFGTAYGKRVGFCKSGIVASSECYVQM